MLGGGSTADFAAAGVAAKSGVMIDRGDTPVIPKTGDVDSHFRRPSSPCAKYELHAHESAHSSSEAARDIPELEAQLAHIDEQLTHVASFSMQTGVGAIGFRSQTHPDARNTEWIRVDLGSEHQVDLVVIVPAIWREAGEGMVADGFPTEFEIRAGGGDPEGQVTPAGGAGGRIR